MADASVVEQWVGMTVSVQLAGVGAMEAKLLQADKIGAEFELIRFVVQTPEGPIEAERSVPGPQAYCFVPWGQIKMLTPLPGEWESR